MFACILFSRARARHSGHGISGMSMGSLWAFAAVGAMFAGGMGLALIL